MRYGYFLFPLVHNTSHKRYILHEHVFMYFLKPGVGRNRAFVLHQIIVFEMGSVARAPWGEIYGKVTEQMKVLLPFALIAAGISPQKFKRSISPQLPSLESQYTNIS